MQNISRYGNMPPDSDGICNCVQQSLQFWQINQDQGTNSVPSTRHLFFILIHKNCLVIYTHIMENSPRKLVTTLKPINKRLLHQMPLLSKKDSFKDSIPHKSPKLISKNEIMELANITMHSSPFKKRSPQKLTKNIHASSQRMKRNSDSVHLVSENPTYTKRVSLFASETKNKIITVKRVQSVGSAEEHHISDEQCPWNLQDLVHGRYELKQVLGQGSFGKVFRAVDDKTLEHVAIKISKGSNNHLEIAQREVRILQLFSQKDPNGEAGCAQMREWFKAKNRIVKLASLKVQCVVFELLSLNLLQLLRKVNYNGLPIDIIKKFAIQILNSLSFLKWQGIIHADIKPENIALKQINKTGIKLVDFGTSIHVTDKHYDYVMSRFYRAPEVILGHPYDCKVDMWSLGCVLAELYLGTPLFPGNSETEQLALLIQCLGLPPQSLITRCSRLQYYFDQNGNILQEIKIRDRPTEPGSCPLSQLIPDASFCAFLQNLLVWDPSKRFTPEQALLDDWIVSSFPQQFRASHYEYVDKLMGRLQTHSQSILLLNNDKPKMQKRRSLQKPVSALRRKFSNLSNRE